MGGATQGQGRAFFTSATAGAAGPGSEAGPAVAMIEALDAATEHLSELGLHAQALAAVHEGRRLQAETRLKSYKARALGSQVKENDDEDDEAQSAAAELAHLSSEFELVSGGRVWC